MVQAVLARYGTERDVAHRLSPPLRFVRCARQFGRLPDARFSEEHEARGGMQFVERLRALVTEAHRAAVAGGVERLREEPAGIEVRLILVGNPVPRPVERHGGVGGGVRVGS